MNWKPVLALLVLSAVAAAVACDDNGLPPAPDPPPQISTVATFTRANGLPHNDVWSILVTSENELWIGTQAGIGVYASPSATTVDRVVNELSGLPNSKVRPMAEYNGRIYVGTWGGGVGVYDLAAEQWSALRVSDGLRAGNVADIVVSPDEDRIYFATTDGVSIYNVTAATFSSFIPPDLLDPVVSAIEVRTVDAEIERWYAPRYESFMTAEDEPLHGITVSRGPSTVFHYTLATTPMAEARVNALFYDAGNSVFRVGFAVAGIAVVDPAARTWTYETMEHGLPSNTIFSITRAAGTLWAGTQEGLARLKGDGRWQGYDRGGGLQADRVRLVYSDEGDRLWLGFVEGGAARVNPASAE